MLVAAQLRPEVENPTAKPVRCRWRGIGSGIPRARSPLPRTRTCCRDRSHRPSPPSDPDLLPRSFASTEPTIGRWPGTPPRVRRSSRPPASTGRWPWAAPDTCCGCVRRCGSTLPLPSWRSPTWTPGRARSATGPDQAARLSIASITAALSRAPRHNIESRAPQRRDVLAVQDLRQPPVLQDAYATVFTSEVAIIAALKTQIDRLGVVVSDHLNLCLSTRPGTPSSRSHRPRTDDDRRGSAYRWQCGGASSFWRSVSSAQMSRMSAWMRARWVKAWGKLPKCRPLTGSSSSA